VVVPLYYFFGSTSTINRFGERFRDGQYSLVSFSCPRAQPFVKVGARVPVFYGVGATAPGDAKYVTEILGEDKNKKVRGIYLFVV